MADFLIPLPGGFFLQFGDSSFVTTATTKAITTRIKNLKYAEVTPNASYANSDLVQAPAPTNATSGSITVTRGAGTTSGLAFNYLFIGY